MIDGIGGQAAGGRPRTWRSRCFANASSAKPGRSSIACARRSPSPTTRFIALPRRVPSGTAWPASSPSPSWERAGDDRACRRHPAVQDSPGPDREVHARSLACRRARGCARALRIPGDAAPAAQRGLSRRRVGAARAGRCGFRRCRHTSVRARRGIAPLQRWADRSGRSSSIGRTVRQFAGDPDAVVRALVDAANDAGGKDNVTAVYVEGERFATSQSGLARDALTAPHQRGRGTATGNGTFGPIDRRRQLTRLTLTTMLLAAATGVAFVAFSGDAGRSLPSSPISTPATTGPLIVKFSRRVDF